MSPAIYKYSAGIRVDCAEERAQCIIKPDNEDSRTDRLQVLRHKPHPKLFARANDKNGDEQDYEIAFKREELSQPA
jgi:hypothetical protein